MALTLTRRSDQAFWIGDSVRVMVASVNGQQVRLTVEAPKDVEVLREELLDADDRRKRQR